MQWLADPEQALGGDGRQILSFAGASAGEVQRVGAQLVDPDPPERDEQVVARHAREAGEPQTFKEPLEAPLRSPCGIPDERVVLAFDLRAAGVCPLQVGAQRCIAARGVVRGSRAKRNAIEVGQLSGTPVGLQRAAHTFEWVIALQWREVGGQKAHPRGLLAVLLFANFAVEVRGGHRDRDEAPVGERDLRRETLGILRGLQARCELAAVAVVLRAALLANA